LKSRCRPMWAVDQPFSYSRTAWSTCATVMLVPRVVIPRRCRWAQMVARWTPKLSARSWVVALPAYRRTSSVTSSCESLRRALRSRGATSGRESVTVGSDVTRFFQYAHLE
jgi:hypothetical protein